MKTSVNDLGDLCPHRCAWSKCLDPQCKEIYKLISEQAEDERTAKRSAHQFKETPNAAETNRRELASDFDVERDIAALSDDVKKQKAEFLGYSPEIVRAMKLAGALSSRQADVLLRRMKGQSWKQVASALGISPRTARRLADPASVQPSRPSARANGTIVARKVKGEKQLRYYRVIKKRFGAWERSFLDLLPERPVNQQVTLSRLKPIHQSPMRNLFAALIGHFTRRGMRKPPPEVSDAEWRLAKKRAAKLLLKNHRRLVGLTPHDVAYSLRGKRKLCPACGTPILHGFRIAGELITRRRAYCDDLCKKNAVRRRKKAY